MPERVVVTGLGAVSPVGNNLATFWDSLTNGRGGVGLLTKFDSSAFNSHVAAEVKNFQPEQYIDPKELRRMSPFIQYAVVAAKMAVEDSGLDLSLEDPYRNGVIIGSGIGGLGVLEEQHKNLLKHGPRRISPFLMPLMLVNMAAGQVSMQLNLKGPSSSPASACTTGGHAVGDAFKAIQRGDADIMFAGGSEAAITPMGFGGFCALKALTTRNDAPERASRPFDLERDGFIMAEGSGILILESLTHAKNRGANIYAELCGYGMSSDAYHVTSPDPEGIGAANAMTMALNDGGINPDEVTYVNAHGTSTKLNDRNETLAAKRVFKERAKKVAISSTKSMTGHLLGAAGAIEAVVISLVLKHGIIPPTINYEHPDPECDLDYVPNVAREVDVQVALSNSLAFGGHNVVLAMKKFNGA